MKKPKIFNTLEKPIVLRPVVFWSFFALVTASIIIYKLFNANPCKIEVFAGHIYTVCYDHQGYPYREHSYDCDHPAHIGE